MGKSDKRRPEKKPRTSRAKPKPPAPTDRTDAPSPSPPSASDHEPGAAGADASPNDKCRAPSDDGKAKAPESASPGPAAPSKGPTCRRCVYALWLRPGATSLLTNNWLLRLICTNSVEQPGVCREVHPRGSCRNFRARREPPVRVEPPEPTDENVRHIALTKGKVATVDAADYEWLSRFRWHATCSRGRYYAATVIDGRSISMHRMIANPGPGEVVDHVDGQSLNNRRANIRTCTPQQNRYNTRPFGKSPYVGVSRSGKRWQAKIKHKGRTLFLGYFDDPVEAARARDAAARKYHGKYAWLNFPEESKEC